MSDNEMAGGTPYCEQPGCPILKFEDGRVLICGSSWLNPREAAKYDLRKYHRDLGHATEAA